MPGAERSTDSSFDAAAEPVGEPTGPVLPWPAEALLSDPPGAEASAGDVGVGMDELGAPATGVPQAAQAAAPEGKEDDLAARLAALHKG